MNRSFIGYFIITLLLILLWGYAAVSKLATYEDFRFQLLGHKVLMEHAGLVAWLVPSIELVIVLLLCIPSTRLVGLFSSFCLLLVFSLYIIYMFQYYPATPCSCSGFISQLGWKAHVVFNLAFSALSFVGVVLTKKLFNNHPT